MAFLSGGIGECLLMVHLGHWGSLKFNRKSKWNYVKIQTTWFQNIIKKKKTRFLIYLRPTSGMRLVDVCFLMACLGHVGSF